MSKACGRFKSFTKTHKILIHGKQSKFILKRMPGRTHEAYPDLGQGLNTNTPQV